MLDGCRRKIDYLRLSVTDRCNLRCLYCMPAQGIEAKPHDEILRYEEIIRVVEAGAQMGIRRVRLTGGEPLVRQNLLELVRSLGGIPGIEDVALTTNGILLGPMAGDLKNAGLDRVNISLDTLKADKFRLVTRGGELARVWEGIEGALEAGLHPVKINVVVVKGLNDGELKEFALLTKDAPLHVRFIELMPFGEDKGWSQSHRVPLPEMRERLAPLGSLEAIQVKGGGPAVNFRLPRSQGSIGFISAISQHFCHRCNRLRLTADGKVKPCLASDQELDLKKVIRSGGRQEDIAAVLTQAIAAKPVEHHLEGKKEQGQRLMYQIGG